MAKRGAADLSVFSVRPPARPAAASPEEGRAEGAATRTYIKKATQITREADKQLALLKAETDKPEYVLIAEALNLLFQQYGKPPMA